jgi:hypothetical protein
MRAIPSSRLARPLALTLTILLSVTATRAQLVSDGATVTLNGITTNVSGLLVVGSTGNNTRLILTNSAVVNSDSTLIGDFGGSFSNLIVVTSAGSRLNSGVGSVFRIGNGGAFNTSTHRTKVVRFVLGIPSHSELLPRG